LLLQLKDVQKSIGVNEILTNISFMIQEREKVALVGVNGAGKTSVFRLLTGEWQADEGAITKPNGMVVGYLPQLSIQQNADDTLDSINHPTDSDGRSLYQVLDDVFIPLKRMEAEIRELETLMANLQGAALESTLKKYDKLSIRFEESGGFESTSRLKGVLRGLGFSDVQWEQPFNTLSGGQRTRALLGKLLLERADLLLLDEPTNHLDIDSVTWLEEYLKGFPGAVLIISHDRYFMDKVVTKTIEIENKKSKVYNGNYSHFVKQKSIDRELEEKHFAEQQKVIKHHESVIKTLRSYKTEAAIIRAKSREKLLDKIERVDKPTEDPDTMRLRLTPTLNSGHDVLHVEGLTHGFDGQALFTGLNFEVKKGDRTALIGPNGVGKTTLIKLLVGELTPMAGRVDAGVNVRVGYYDQNTALDESKNIFEEIADTYPRMTQTLIRTTLAAFMFIGDDVFKPISALSGGERGRVQLAKIMLAGANFLVLDEPTNHLDLFSKEILEEALREFTGTLLYISHDRYFINNTATKVLDLTATGLKEYAGDYDYYLEKSQAMAAVEAIATDMPSSEKNISSKEDYKRKKELDAQARRKKSRLEKLEKEISETENKIAACDTQMEDEETARDAEALQKIFTSKTELEEHLNLLYEEWADISD